MFLICLNTQTLPVHSTVSARTFPVAPKVRHPIIWRALLAHPEARALAFRNTSTQMSHPTATQPCSVVAISATIHLTWAAFGRKIRKCLAGFAKRPQHLVVSAEIAGEHKSCFRIGSLLALLWCYLSASFWRSKRPHQTHHKLTNGVQSQLPRALLPTVKFVGRGFAAKTFGVGRYRPTCTVIGSRQC